MTNATDLLAPFDDRIVETVAGRHDVAAADLRDLLARHQRQARDNPGVENLVYEWRSGFRGQPLVHRTGDTYYLRVPDHVWGEFATALDIPEIELRAMVDVHEEQTRRDTGAGPGDERQAMVLGRPRR